MFNIVSEQVEGLPAQVLTGGNSQFFYNHRLGQKEWDQGFGGSDQVICGIGVGLEREREASLYVCT